MEGDGMKHKQIRSHNHDGFHRAVYNAMQSRGDIVGWTVFRSLQIGLDNVIFKTCNKLGTPLFKKIKGQI
jgi:hypothetical protein